MSLPRSSGRRLVLAAVLVPALLFAVTTTAEEARAKAFSTGFADFAFPSTDDRWLDRTVELDGRIVRINAYWRHIAPSRPTNPTDPADPAYDWSVLDRIVRAADARGLKVMITAYNAPEWAEGPGRPSDVPQGSWKVKAGPFGEFGEALASRYAGRFDPDGGGPLGVLPDVRYLQAWNEQNLDHYFAPQYSGHKPRSPQSYRRLLNAFYEGVNAGNGKAKVMVGGTGPYGDPVGGHRMRPLAFWRDVFCLKGAKRLKATKCKTEAKFDIFAHHPINTTGNPKREAADRDDATTADLRDLTGVLRAAERKNTVKGARKHPVWADEFWIESDPPDGLHGVPLMRQAEWIELSLYLLWKQGARAAVYFQVADSEFFPSDPEANLQSGVLFADWQPKPAATGFRFPFVAEPKRKQKWSVWSIPPMSGRLAIECKRGSDWKTEKTVKAKSGKPLQTKIKLRGSTSCRAAIGGEASLADQLKG